MNKFKLIITLFLYGLLPCHSQLLFNNLDSLLKYAERRSVSVKIADQQDILAKWTKVSAIANTINYRSPITFYSNENIMLPVNFIPSEVFGGPAGTFRAIPFGLKYITNFNLNPQIDIINIQTWTQVKSASINKQLTELNKLITKKTLFENIAAAFYNCASLSEQITLTEIQLQTADSLVLILENRFKEGIVREQDLNNSVVNRIGINDKLIQLQLSLSQQYKALQILSDIKDSIKIVPDQNQKIILTDKTEITSKLNSKYSRLQAEFSQNEMRVNRRAMLPILSLVYYQNWAQNSNQSPFDNPDPWIQSNYYGFRLTFPFPPEVNKISQSYTSKINYNIAMLNSQHADLQNELNNETLVLDYQKSVSAHSGAEKILKLKQANYEKSVNQFNQGILSADNLLIAFNDLLISRLNFVTAKSSLSYNSAKIKINNSFQ